MTVCREGQRQHSALVIVDWAIRENILSSSLDALISALAQAMPHGYGDAFDKYRDNADYLTDIREAVTRGGHHALTDDEVHRWFTRYLGELEVLEPTLADDIQDRDEIEDSFLGAFDKLRPFLREGRDHISLEPSIGDYEAILAIASGAYARQALVLAPLYYLLLAPFEPIDAWARLHAELLQLVRLETNGVPVVELLAALAKKQTISTPAFLRLMVAADSRLITVRTPKERVTELSKALPRAHFFARAVSRHEYVQHAGPFAFMQSDGRFGSRLGWPEILVDKARKAFSQLATPCRKLNVAWHELASKLAIVSLDPPTLEQDLPLEVHREIVLYLTRLGRAASRKEIVSALGTPIGLAPELLPPGRILAYARHPRFLKPQNAYYVLSDWVETDSHKRGRILRNRIVTPLEVKDVTVEKAMVRHLLDSDALYLGYRILDAANAVNAIASQLPGRPTEPYYTNAIRKNLSMMLAIDHVAIGLGFWILKSAYQLRKVNQSLRDWRIEILQHIFRDGESLEAQIRAIDDSRVRKQLMRMLQQKDTEE